MNLFRPIVFFNPKQQTFSPMVRDWTNFKTYRLKTLKIFYDLPQKLYKRKRNNLHFLSLNVARLLFIQLLHSIDSTG
jgi:hypothetical protein